MLSPASLHLEKDPRGQRESNPGLLLSKCAPIKQANGAVGMSRETDWANKADSTAGLRLGRTEVLSEA